jgi:hypothetical protein
MGIHRLARAVAASAIAAALVAGTAVAAQPRVRSRSGRWLVAPIALSLLLATAGVASAAANTACPAGFETITVAQAVSAGYLTTPVRLDKNGNNDGTVCRRALGDGVFNVLPNATVDTIYEWMDNSSPRNG